MEVESTDVAVVGLGALGLVTLKNLAEEGFRVTGFERNGYVGGLWQYVEGDKTSVLPSTIINVSKERGCFTDFPFPDYTGSLSPASEVQKYLESYADAFNLRSRMRLNTVVTGVRRDKTKMKWVVGTDGGSPQLFDKVVLATGINQVPIWPSIEGIDLFQGTVIHSRAFKRPEEFARKDVLIVGLGNTGADTAVALVGHANNIYVSHREGAYMLPRTNKGRSIDHTLTARLLAIQSLMERLFPNLTQWLFDHFVQRLQDGAFTIRPEWHLSPAPSLRHATPIISDEIVGCLETGAVKSKPGVARVTGPRAVELSDGATVEADAIVFCTGYKADFSSLVEPAYDPTRDATPRWAAAGGSKGRPLPRLYRNIFSLDEPSSLAYMGALGFPAPAFQLYDLASMALAQAWRPGADGASALPPREEMEREVHERHEWLCGIAERGSVFPGLVKADDWMRWANDVAGTGVNEHMGWGWAGLKFWLTEPRWCSMLMGGVYSPHLFRLFDGKRKKWDGARQEIEKVNRKLEEKPKET